MTTTNDKGKSTEETVIEKLERRKDKLEKKMKREEEAHKTMQKTRQQALDEINTQLTAFKK